MKFYKRDPDRALAGMAELTMKQRGAYNSLLDLLYSRDGVLPDDDVRVARMMSCHWREWAALKRELIAAGKVWVEDGLLRAKRVQETLKEASDFSQDQSRRASQRWQKTKSSNENNETDMPAGNALTPTPTPTPTVRKKGSLSPPNPDANRRERDLDTQSSKSTENGHDLTGDMVEAWNETAADLGLATVRTLTDKRRKLAKQALKQIGGIEAFRRAIGLIGQSDFLLGRTSRDGWKADFDFVLRVDKLVKLAEGGYSNRGANGTREQHPPSATEATDTDTWAFLLSAFYGGESQFAAGYWPAGYGPKPGEPGCFAPAHLVEKYRRPPMKGDTRTGDAA